VKVAARYRDPTFLGPRSAVLRDRGAALHSTVAEAAPVDIRYGVFHASAEPSRPVNAKRLQDLLSRFQVVADLNMPQLPLHDAEIRGKTFHGCNFSNASGKNLLLADCTFELCFLPFTDFQNVRMENASIKNSVFSCSSMTVVAFLGSNIIQCSFNGIIAEELLFEDCDLLHSRFDHALLTSTEFRNCNVKEARFIGTPLEGVTFTSANPEDAVFSVEEGW
jgi:uncharacterized protein YjbI with pentapeptide repeats